MNDQHEREALELTGLLQAAVLYPDAVRTSGIARPLLASAGNLVEKLDGTARTELEIARANLAALEEG